MKKRSNIRLQLSPAEKSRLRSQKTKQSELLDLEVDEIEHLLEVPFARAREIHALAEFQQISSIGIKFAEDLIFLGYFSLSELADQEGAQLVEAYEQKKGYWIDACVEDQFRLVVEVARHGDLSKNWWDFTQARKAYRQKHGYPADRPETPWTEVVEIKRKGGKA